MNVFKFPLLVIAGLILSITAGSVALASVSNGTINASDKYTRICHNVSCTSYGNINWKPTLSGATSGASAVTITDTAITGYIWGDEIGWVNLAPSGLAGADVLKVNPTTGVITGKAFASGGSWINFNPTTVGGGATVGVTINDDGEFEGWAWVSGLYGGWMEFDCGSGATCITTVPPTEEPPAEEPLAEEPPPVEPPAEEPPPSEEPPAEEPTI